MMTFAIGTVKFTVTQGAIVSGPGAMHIILTVKSATRRTTSPLTGMISPIVGVEPPFTVNKQGNGSQRQERTCSHQNDHWISINESDGGQQVL